MAKHDGYSIRYAAGEDLPAVKRIMRLHRDAGFTPSTALEAAVGGRNLLIIAHDDAPVGYALLTHARSGRSHLASLAVSRELWRDGHGTSLLETAANVAREAGSRIMTLKCAVETPATLFWHDRDAECIAVAKPVDRWLAAWRFKILPGEAESAAATCSRLGGKRPEQWFVPDRPGILKHDVLEAAQHGVNRLRTSQPGAVVKRSGPRAPRRPVETPALLHSGTLVSGRSAPTLVRAIERPR